MSMSTATQYSPQVNSGWLTAAIALPVVGPFVQHAALDALDPKLKQACEKIPEDVPRAVQLIRLRNQYYLAAVMRELISVILIVAAVANGIFSSYFGTLTAPPLILFSMINSFRIIENIATIKKIKERGGIYLGLVVHLRLHSTL